MYAAAPYRQAAKVIFIYLPESLRIEGGETTSQGWDRVSLSYEEQKEIARMRAMFQRLELPELEWEVDQYVLFDPLAVVSYFLLELLVPVLWNRYPSLGRHLRCYGLRQKCIAFIRRPEACQ